MYANKEIYRDLKESIDLAETYLSDWETVWNIVNALDNKLPTLLLKLPYLYFSASSIDKFSETFTGSDHENIVELYTLLGRIVFVLNSENLNKMYKAVPKHNMVLEVLNTYLGNNLDSVKETKNAFLTHPVYSYHYVVKDNAPVKHLFTTHNYFKIMLDDIAETRKYILPTFGPKGKPNNI